ncbi:UNVERIFIED_CONTAM: hypothetical protein PYX00_001088 [Menopon gallinae]|uniref:Uncharacterized protein n=1 Tax=Menopon gallinae TaxID=328185 RepID=A0AAW2IC88_9NEOP
MWSSDQPPNYDETGSTWTSFERQPELQPRSIWRIYILTTPTDPPQQNLPKWRAAVTTSRRSKDTIWCARRQYPHRKNSTAAAASNSSRSRDQSSTSSKRRGRSNTNREKELPLLARGSLGGGKPTTNKQSPVYLKSLDRRCETINTEVAEDVHRDSFPFVAVAPLTVRSLLLEIIPGRRTYPFQQTHSSINPSSDWTNHNLI